MHLARISINPSFFEEAGTYIADTLNDEYQNIDNIDGTVNLFDAHRLFFFYESGQSRIFTLTMGHGRDILGFRPTGFANRN